MHVGRKNQYLRAENNHHISQVAEYLKISPKALMDIENGTTTPSDEILDKIALLYRVEVDSLKNDDNKIVLSSSKKKTSEVKPKKKEIHLRSYTRRWIKFWLIIAQFAIVGALYAILEPNIGNPGALGSILYLLISIPLMIIAFINLNKAKSRSDLVGIGIVTLIFVSFIAGVMMLTLNDDKFVED